MQKFQQYIDGTFRTVLLKAYSLVTLRAHRMIRNIRAGTVWLRTSDDVIPDPFVMR